MAAYEVTIHKILVPGAEAALLAVWESAVRATHDFLDDSDVSRIRECVGPALRAMDIVLIAEKPDKTPVAFLGGKDDKIEMLFVQAEYRGGGIGRLLVAKSVDEFGLRLVDVNEQNTQGIGFYRRLGFETFARSPIDDQGEPYPILHMRLATHR